MALNSRQVYLNRYEQKDLPLEEEIDVKLRNIINKYRHKLQHAIFVLVLKLN